MIVPSQPAELRFSNINSTSFQVKWAGGSGAVAYSYSLNDRYTIPSIDLGSINNYAVFTNLEPGSRYSIIVTAANIYGSTSSNIVSILLPPGEPVNLTYYIASSNTIRIAWSGGLGATSYIYRINDMQVQAVLDMGLQKNYAILQIANLSTLYKIVVIAINIEYNIKSAELSVSLFPRQFTASKKTIICVYTNQYPFSFGEFVRGLLYLLNYANNNRMGVRLNIENSILYNYLIVDNYKIPPGYQTKIYYNEKDDMLLADDLQIFKESENPICLVTTNHAIRRNEIDSLSIIEFNKLIQFIPAVYDMLNDRLKRDLLNSVSPPSYSDDYNVLNMYLADLSLNRNQILSLAQQVRESIDVTKTYIIISNSPYIRSTLIEFMGSYHTLEDKTIDTLDSLESSIVDFIISSRSKKIYTFSEYNTKSKKVSYNLSESTSLSSLTVTQLYYITTTFAGIYPEAEFTDGNTETAAFAYPCGITKDLSGNVYIADTMNNNIRQIQPTGQVVTLPGNFSGPTGITVDISGNLYVVDAINALIRKISLDGKVITLAGSTAGFKDDIGSKAQFNFLYATNP